MFKKGSCSKGVVRGKHVESDVDSVEVIILESDYDSPHNMNSDDTWEPGKDVTKNTSNFVSVKGRKCSTSKKVSCFKSTKTKPFKNLKFFDNSSSNDQGVVRGQHVESDFDSVEVIILESDFDSPHNMNFDDTWEPGKDVTKNTSNSVSVKGRKDDEGVVRGKPVESDVELKVVSVSDAIDAKRPPLVRNYILGLASLRTWQQIMQKDFGIKSSNKHVAASQEGTSKGKRKMV
ncbi:hypothetical protein Tco_0952179 [Tanacetum coccineum]|uniref:Uncharacterized protein n=1 Tax=Tanacetum coccineum TaxID=301880 RepID=A0ABQ5E2Z0_9ASTR